MFCPPGPCLRPPGFRKWGIIFMFRRHEPAPSFAAVAFFTTLCLQAAKGLTQRTPKLSYFINTVSVFLFSLITWICFIEPSLSLTNDSVCVSHVWGKCVARCSRSYKKSYFDLPACRHDLIIIKKQNTLYTLGLKCVEDNTHLCTHVNEILLLERHYFSSSLLGFPCRKSTFFMLGINFSLFFFFLNPLTHLFSVPPTSLYLFHTLLPIASPPPGPFPLCLSTQRLKRGMYHMSHSLLTATPSHSVEWHDPALHKFPLSGSCVCVEASILEELLDPF